MRLQGQDLRPQVGVDGDAVCEVVFAGSQHSLAGIADFADAFEGRHILEVADDPVDGFFDDS